MAFSSQFLDELRLRAGLADVIGRRVRLTHRGREHQGLCPFHKEKTPSFTVNEEKGFWHCFGCGAHGSVIDFVMQTEGLNFPEAVRKLAADAGMTAPDDTPEAREKERRRHGLLEVMEEATAFFEKMLKMPEGRGALDYLKDRGVAEETIKTFRLGFAPPGYGGLKGELTRAGISEDQMVEAGLLIQPHKGEGSDKKPYDRFRGRVMFPIADDRGRVIAFGGRILGDGEPKYLNSPETPLFHKGRVLYGFDHAAMAARRHSGFLVVEGYTDVLALHQAGLEYAVASLGTALTEEHFPKLWRVVPNILLCFDGDAAGLRAAAAAAERAVPLLRSGSGLMFMTLPAGRDPDETIQEEGKEAFRRLEAAAEPLSEILWRAISARHGGIRTAEARAAAEKDIVVLARRFEDSFLRSHFLSCYKGRLWRRKRGAVLSPPPLPAPAPTDRPARARRALLAALINHPDVLAAEEERLGRYPFPEASLERLRQAVAGALAEDPGITAAELRRRLQNKMTAVCDKLFVDPRVVSSSWLHSAADPDLVRDGWARNMAVLAAATLNNDLASLTDVSDEGLRRRLEIKRAVLREVEVCEDDAGRW